MQRWEGGELVWVEGVVDDDQRISPQLVDCLVVDLDHGGNLVPGWRAGPQEVGEEREKAHQQQRGDKAPVVLPAVDPEDEPNNDRHDEMHEVQDHRDQVLGTNDAGVVKGAL
jgi:hypothetical protein